MKLRLQPIRVFCFHQVSESFDESTMYEGDWMSTPEFIQHIADLRQQGYTFISLPEAHKHMKHDLIRTRKYAVLTADDGWASLKNILPWLNEQRIPVTLFLNPAYMDGKHFRERETEKYLTDMDIKNLYIDYPLVTVGLHGYEHIDVTTQDKDAVEDSINRSVASLGKYPNYIPYFSYPWDKHNSKTDSILLDNGLMPLYLCCNMNYNDSKIIDRELL